MEDSVNIKNLNGWSISEDLYRWILKNIKPHSTVLELGSGKGSIELSKNYKLYSIEHNKSWLNLSENITYIYSPIKKYEGYRWYDKNTLKESLPKSYQLILVDGPTGRIGRSGFFENISLFNTNVPIIIDDYNRQPEKALANNISKKLNKPIKVIGGVEKSFAIIK